MQLLGNKALQIFQTSAITQSFIKTLDPSWVEMTVPEEYTVSFNEDGSATINEVVVEPVLEEVIEEPVLEEITPE